MRVWCTESGDCLAELDSCLPPPLPPAGADSSGGGAGAAANGADGGDAAGAVLPDVSAEAAAAVAAAVEAEEEEAEPSGGRARQQYHRGWEGVTAMACRGALLVTGSSEGNVLERDFSHGGLPEGEGEGAGGGGLAGKFWQWSLASDG